MIKSRLNKLEDFFRSRVKVVPWGQIYDAIKQIDSLVAAKSKRKFERNFVAQHGTRESFIKERQGG